MAVASVLIVVLSSQSNNTTATETRSTQKTASMEPVELSLEEGNLSEADPNLNFLPLKT